MINYLGLCCLVFLFAQGAEPIQHIKGWFHVASDSEYRNKFQYFFVKLLNCSLCAGFYFGIAYYQNILFACLVSIGSEIITRILNRL